MIVIQKSHDLPFKEMLLAPQKKMGGLDGRTCLCCLRRKHLEQQNGLVVSRPVLGEERGQSR